MILSQARLKGDVIKAPEAEQIETFAADKILKKSDKEKGQEQKLDGSAENSRSFYYRSWRIVHSRILSLSFSIASLMIR